MLWGELIRHAHGYHDDEEEEAGLQDPELVSPAPGPAPCCRPHPPVTSLLLPLPSGSLDRRAAAAPGGGAWPRLRPLLHILINLFIPNKGRGRGHGRLRPHWSGGFRGQLWGWGGGVMGSARPPRATKSPKLPQNHPKKNSEHSKLPQTTPKTPPEPCNPPPKSPLTHPKTLPAIPNPPKIPPNNPKLWLGVPPPPPNEAITELEAAGASPKLLIRTVQKRG